MVPRADPVEGINVTEKAMGKRGPKPIESLKQVRALGVLGEGWRKVPAGLRRNSWTLLEGIHRGPRGIYLVAQLVHEGATSWHVFRLRRPTGQPARLAPELARCTTQKAAEVVAGRLARGLPPVNVRRWQQLRRKAVAA